MPVSLPPTNPDSLSQVATRRPNLSQEQFSKLALLLQHLNSDTLTLPDNVKDVKSAQKQRLKKEKDPKNWVGKPVEGSGQRALNEQERCYLSSEQCQRFLRATKWDLPSAFARTEETIVWRREFGVEEINNDPSIVEEESRTGKEMVLGWDVQGRPCLYMFPWKQNTKQSHRQIQFVVWCLERAIDMMGPNVEGLCLLIDFGSGDKAGGQPTSLGQAKKVLDILQNYYCERLGRAICINVPTLFWGFYRLVGPFVDPVTKDKIRFNPDPRTLVPPSQLEKENFNGDYDFVYQHEEYYPFLDQMCRKRREEQFVRWKQFGNGKCGLSEFITRGGMEEARAKEAAEELAEEEKKKQAAALPSGREAGGAVGLAAVAPATAGGVSSLMGHSKSQTTASSASSLRSMGYQEPPEAATAPDWVEPPSSTPSSIRSRSTTDSSSIAMPDTPTRSATGSADFPPTINEKDQSLLDSVPRSNTRPRGDSVDSFVTSRDDSTTPQPESQVGSEAMKQNGTQDTHGNTTLEGLSTGIKGMIINPDGSMSFA